MAATTAPERVKTLETAPIGAFQVPSARRKLAVPPPEAGTQPTRAAAKIFDPQIVTNGTSLSWVPPVLFQTAMSLTVEDPGPTILLDAENAAGG